MALCLGDGSTMIEITRFTELDTEIKSALKGFIKNEFGHIPIVKQTEWASPDWTVIYFVGNQIATFYNIIEREISIDGKESKVAGINNVITPKEFRGNGYASKLLSETENLIFEKLKSEFGVLLCADSLIPFYEKLGWYKIDCPVYFKQSVGERLWGANTMLLTKGKKVTPTLVKLNGLPW